MRRGHNWQWFLTGLLAVTASCASSDARTSTGVAESGATIVASPGQIVIDADGTGQPFDRRLLGTNAPAWIRPSTLADPAFQQRVEDLGTTLIRMPGGSWSSSYDWLACENGDGKACFWTWAARPSDYVGFLADTGLTGMWTVNFNGTAQEAAALVAFFNGSVTDTRTIGVDRRGKDWGTIAQWALLRTKHGHSQPQPIPYWEIGNEVYGAKAESAPGCASFGWEAVWTCDGSEYVEGDAGHDGYLDFRTAMRNVDSNIEVGAVGIGGYQSDWGGFGYGVIRHAADALDFYIVHDYGFDSRPSAAAVLRRPGTAWPDSMRSVRSALKDQNPDRTVPTAVTEYNLFAFADGDTEAYMSEAIDALYIADTIGQMAEQGISIANQWNLVNGENSTGSDYGLLDTETGMIRPQYFGLAMWARFGDELIPSVSGFDPESTLAVYAGRSTSGSLTLLVINKSESVITASVNLRDSVETFDAQVDQADAGSLDSSTMRFNGAELGEGALIRGAGHSQTVGAQTPFDHQFPGVSITLFTFVPRTVHTVSSEG